MLESLLFLTFIGIGIFFVVVLMILWIISYVIKSSALRKVAFYLGIIPAFCFGIIFLYYAVILPFQKKTQMEDYAGTYVTEQYSQTQIILHKKGTYRSYNSEQTGIDTSGTWKTGGIDGTFEFYDAKGSLKSRAIPSEIGSRITLEFDRDQHQYTYFRVSN